MPRRESLRGPPDEGVLSVPFTGKENTTGDRGKIPMSEPVSGKNESDAKTRTLPTEKREQLGKYEIIEKIGDGGFGVVYKGYDPFIKRNVALKTCTSPEREIRERFFREAEISGKLDHPNIVRVLDFGLHEETPFMVQEFLVGENLEKKIRARQVLAYSEQLLILIQIARALEYAHSKA